MQCASQNLWFGISFWVKGLQVCFMYYESCFFTMSFHGWLVLSLGQGLGQQCLVPCGFSFYTSARVVHVTAGSHSQTSHTLTDMLPHGLLLSVKPPESVSSPTIFFACKCSFFYCKMQVYAYWLTSSKPFKMLTVLFDVTFKFHSAPEQISVSKSTSDSVFTILKFILVILRTSTPGHCLYMPAQSYYASSHLSVCNVPSALLTRQPCSWLWAVYSVN